jgi:hypothetical protein
VAYTGSALARDFTPLLSHSAHHPTQPGAFVPALPGLTGNGFTVVVASRAADDVRDRFAPYGARVAVLGIDTKAEAIAHWGIADDTVLVVRPDLYIGARAALHQLDEVSGYLDTLLTA